MNLACAFVRFQEAVPGESIFIRDQRYLQISNGHSDVVFDLFISINRLII